MTNFTFLPNGKPVSTLKNEARKLHKSGKAKSRTEALNMLSRAEFNKSFNKLMKDLEKASPVVKDGILYIPFEINMGLIDADLEGSFFYYVAMNNDEIALSKDYQISTCNDAQDALRLNNDDFTSKLKYENFEKIDTGWILRPSHTKLSYYFQKTDEGLLVDIYENEEVIDSTYLYFGELFETNINFSSLQGKEPLSDYKASVLFNHCQDSDKTELFTLGGITVNLYSTWILADEDVSYNPSEIMSYIINSGDKDAFYRWLQGQSNAKFDHYELTASPWFGFEWDYDDIGEVFGEIPTDLSEISFEIAQLYFE